MYAIISLYNEDGETIMTDQQMRPVSYSEIPMTDTMMIVTREFRFRVSNVIPKHKRKEGDERV